MKTKKIIAALTAMTISMTVLGSCGSTDSTGVDNGAAAKATAAVVANDQEAALAKELLDRSPTPEDKITDGVVNEFIKLLKEKYPPETVGTIYVEGDYDTYAVKGKGWYEALYADSGNTVEIQQSCDDNEPSLMERGELHFANRMLYPYLIDKQNDPDNKIIAVWNSGNPSKNIIAIVVRADSEYQSFADLKGKKIASSAAGCPYSALIELAVNEGWEYGVDFEHVNTKEYTSALLAGEVDAICYHPNGPVAPLLISGEGKIIDTALDGGVYQSGGGDRVVFGPTDFVEKNPNVTHSYVKLMEVAGAWLVNNKEEAGEVRESIDRSPKDTAVYWIGAAAETYYTSQDSLEDLKANAYRFSEWLVQYDKNFEAPIDVENGFYAEEYFKT